MDRQEKYDAKLRWGLSLKKILESNKRKNELVKLNTGKKDKNIIDSFGKLDKESEVTKSTLVNLVQGKISAEITTWTAIIKALKISLTDFASIHDAITKEELEEHKSKIQTDRKSKVPRRKKR